MLTTSDNRLAKRQSNALAGKPGRLFSSRATQDSDGSCTSVMSSTQSMAPHYEFGFQPLEVVGELALMTASFG